MASRNPGFGSIRFRYAYDAMDAEREVKPRFV
jgi:hypothetical protein